MVLPILVLCSLTAIFATTWAASDKIVCYYTNWSTYRTGDGKYSPEDVDPTLCTQIIYSFAILDDTTYTMKSHDQHLDVNQGFMKKIVDLKKKNNKLKVLIAIGGWTDSLSSKYSKMVSDKQLRENFIRNALAFIKLHGFDGLDLDWEYPAPNDKANFATFVKELKAAFKPFNLLLTAAVSGAKWKIDEAYDVKSLGQDLDQIHIMAYDFKGAWDGKTGHHAAIYSPDGLSDDGAVEHFIKMGAPKEKLILGMPLYGRSWTLASAGNNGIGAQTSGPGQAGKYTGEGGILAYYEICSTSWSKVVTDPSGKMGPFAYKDKQWTSYDDESILKKKVEFLKAKGLGGAMVWDLALDDFNGKHCGVGRYPLMNAINNAMGLAGSNGGTTITPRPTTAPPPTTPRVGGPQGGGETGECKADGDLLPHESDCGKFYKCGSNGVKFELSCPPPLQFSTACNCCNWAALSGCKNKNA